MSIALEERDRADSLDQAAETFTEVRSRLFGIAYRVLADPAEAEDIVQETWLRWQGSDRATIVNPPAFLALITTRLSINTARSARVRSVTSLGSLLPELVDPGNDPAVGAERGEALERALLVLLERLTPAQRAAYVLREAFVYPYERIAEIIQVSPVNVRQLVSRARRHLGSARREPIDVDDYRRFLAVFLDAAQRGHMTALENLLAEDVVGSPADDRVSGRAA
ncbi:MULTISPECIES: sigma-70 family RNA polymerase sigma factor [unclassified Actinomadura]|uniref:sigma-70 family RNA polymerase sigma factor n=1 Tax=unclassified Actinomadura TaxID=2626254 RepID=UPI0011EC286B|nr:sigma-70 family RNA polymerase sigma factor [Actinomadura sp. K4S16]